MRMAGRRAVRSASRGRRLRHLRTFPLGGRHVPLGCPRDRVPGGWSRAVWPARRRVAPCRASDCAPPSGSVAGRFRHLAKRHLPLTPPGRLARRGGRGDAGGPSSGRGGASRAARLASRGTGQVILPRLATKPRTGGATHDVGPPCVVVIGFDEAHRLPSRRFRRASEVVCSEPCRWGLEPGVTARRRGSSLWVILLDLPVGISSTQRVRVTVHGFLHKAGVSGSYRRVG